ncbi:uncharacterized protein [Penaeus vannamei]|uniref:uncharacterized protein n=1 Tax=Penaeus vannamei TaxID=6689 RepID=UPI00387F9C40
MAHRRGHALALYQLLGHQPRVKLVGESLREPHRWMMGPAARHSLLCGTASAGVAEVASNRSNCPRLNLRLEVRVGAWNVRSLRQDDRLPLLSRELGRLRVEAAALSEGVAIAISSKLQPSVVEVTPIDERKMVLRLKLSFGFMSLIAVYAPTDDFARSQKLRISGSWYQRLDPNCWTWYSDAGNAAKEIDYILIRHSLEDPSELQGLQDLTDPALLWDTFKHETLDAAQDTIDVCPRAIQNFISQETLEAMDACRAARLTGDWEFHHSHVRRTRSLLRKDKEQFIRSLAKEVEGHFLVNDLPPAYQALRKPNSKPSFKATAVCLVSGQIISDTVAVRICWAEYFEQLYQVDPPAVNVDARSAEITLPDPPISEDPPSLTEVLAHMLLRRIRDQLLRHQRLEQSGYTPRKSTIDCILMLRVIVERRREFGHGLLAAYIDLKKAFDTVTDLDFADDVAILFESLETLEVALDAFSNEAKPFGSQQTDWPGSRGHELTQQEYLEMSVPVQKDQAMGFQGPDNDSFGLR